MDSKVIAKRAFIEQLVVIPWVKGRGPFAYFNLNSLSIALYNQSRICSRFLDLDMNLDLDLNRARNLNLTRERDLDLDLNRDINLDLDLNLDLYHDRDLARERVRDLNLNRVINLDLDLDRDRERTLSLARGQNLRLNINFWQTIIASPNLYSPILNIFCDAFNLIPRAQWFEALRIGFLPKLPSYITLYNESLWKSVEISFEKKDAGEAEIYFAAWQLLFDSWLYIHGYIKSREESIVSKLEKLTNKIDEPPIRIAHCIRDLAYGDKSQIKKLALLAKSDDTKYRSIFEECLWRLTPEEELRAKKIKEKQVQKKMK